MRHPPQVALTPAAYGRRACSAPVRQRVAKASLRMPKTSPPASTPAPENAFLIVDGRRWRTTDPGIPSTFRQELVNELMAARRAVGDGQDQLEVRDARRRVHDAKLALGERGHPWWLPPTPAATKRRIEAACRALLRSRQPGRSICPSDIARIVGGDTWRALLPAVRERAVQMSECGELEILRGGRVVKRNPTAGVLRYRLPRRARAAPARLTTA